MMRSSTGSRRASLLCKRAGAPKGDIREIQAQRISVTAPGYAEAIVTFDCRGAQ